MPKRNCLGVVDGGNTVREMVRPVRLRMNGPAAESADAPSEQPANRRLDLITNSNRRARACGFRGRSPPLFAKPRLYKTQEARVAFLADIFSPSVARVAAGTEFDPGPGCV